MNGDWGLLVADSGSRSKRLIGSSSAENLLVLQVGLVVVLIPVAS